jgi:hypothetical protein
LMHPNMQPFHTVHIQFLHTVFLYTVTVSKNCMEGCMTDRGGWDEGGSERRRESEEKRECE